MCNWVTARLIFNRHQFTAVTVIVDSADPTLLTPPVTSLGVSASLAPASTKSLTFYVVLFQTLTFCPEFRRFFTMPELKLQVVYWDFKTKVENSSFEIFNWIIEAKITLWNLQCNRFHDSREFQYSFYFWLFKEVLKKKIVTNVTPRGGWGGWVKSGVRNTKKREKKLSKCVSGH